MRPTTGCDLAWIALGAALFVAVWCALAVVLRLAAGLVPAPVWAWLY